MRIARWGMILFFLLTACGGVAVTSADLPVLASATPSPALPMQTDALTLPSPTLQPSATPLPPPTPCPEGRGHFEEGSLDSSLMKRALTYRIYLPPCYNRQTGATYPLLILLHGQSYRADQWERLGMGTAADALITAGQVRPFVILLPEEWNTSIVQRESAYGRALIEELLPYVEERYALCRERACRAIGGLSRGAAWALDLAFEHPDLFSAVGAHSLAPYYGQETHLRRIILDHPETLFPRVYLDTGRADRYRTEAISMEEMFTRLGVPHEWYFNEGLHEEPYWQAHVSAYLRWYTRDWTP